MAGISRPVELTKEQKVRGSDWRQRQRDLFMRSPEYRETVKRVAGMVAAIIQRGSPWKT